MTELVAAFQMSDDELLEVLRNSLYPGARDESIKLVISWCRASGKDPLLRPVHIVPMSVKIASTNRYEWRDVLMPGVNNYRVDAARTGQHAGNDSAEFGPDITQDFDGVKITYPAWCEFVVYRVVNGVRCPFSSGKVRWLETYVSGRDTTVPNAMWKKRIYGQLEKCAEALALRRGFPEVGAQPTVEEMEGRILEVDELPTKLPVEQPRSKSDASRAQHATPALPNDPSEFLPATSPAELPETASRETVAHDDRTAENGHLPIEDAFPSESESAPGKKASKSAVHVVQIKLEQAGLTTNDLKKKFGYNLDGITLSNINDVLKWISAPTA